MSVMMVLRVFCTIIGGILFFGVPLPVYCEAPKSIKVQPCRYVSRSPPITRRCVAAAIAEEAFLSATHRQVSLYTIYSLNPLKTRWRFVIEEGDEAHPPAEGAHWFIFIHRISGSVEVEAGR